MYRQELLLSLHNLLPQHLKRNRDKDQQQITTCSTCIRRTKTLLRCAQGDTREDNVNVTEHSPMISE